MKSTRTYLTVFFLLTTVAGLVLAYRQYQENVRLNAQLSDPKTGLTKELADARKTIRELRDQLAALRKAGPAAEGEVADAGGGPAAGAAGDNRQNRDDRRNAFRAVLNSPQFQALRALQEKSQLDSRYADLFKTLVAQYNLSPAQIDQFKSLLVQRQQAQNDARQAAIQNGLNPRTDPQGFQAAVSAATGDVDNQIKATIGDAGYAQYQTYNQTAPQRATVSQLQQSLSYSSTPLTDSQAQQLVALLQQNSTTTGNGGTQRIQFFGGGGPPGFGGGPSAPITSQVITQAASILNASQVQALQQLQQTQQAQQQMSDLMRSTFQNTRKSKGG